jgi:hypothetical protein
MRHFVVFACVLVISGSVLAEEAEEVRLSHEELVELVSESAAEALCTDTDGFIGCAGITAKACTNEVAGLVKGDCSKRIPAGDASVDEVSAVGKEVGRCVTSMLVRRHKERMRKNAESPACMSFLK